MSLIPVHAACPRSDRPRLGSVSVRISSCLTAVAPKAAHRYIHSMQTYRFRSTGAVLAYVFTKDPIGANLPPENGPWEAAGSRPTEDLRPDVTADIERLGYCLLLAPVTVTHSTLPRSADMTKRRPRSPAAIAAHKDFLCLLTQMEESLERGSIRWTPESIEDAKRRVATVFADLGVIAIRIRPN